jgi:hypothetical protein
MLDLSRTDKVVTPEAIFSDLPETVEELEQDKRIVNWLEQVCYSLEHGIPSF